MKAAIIRLACLALLLTPCLSAADEILLDDDFSGGIGPAWTVYGNAYEYNSRLLVWSSDVFDSGVESIPFERPDGATLCIQGEYSTNTWPSGEADRGIVGFQWDSLGHGIWHHLQFITGPGDTLVNRIRYIVHLPSAGFVFEEADLGSFSADKDYMWRFEFTGDECVISIDEGNGWETRYNGTDDLLLDTITLCLTGTGDGGGWWDDILVSLREQSPVESLSWGRVKALYR